MSKESVNQVPSKTAQAPTTKEQLQLVKSRKSCLNKLLELAKEVNYLDFGAGI